MPLTLSKSKQWSTILATPGSIPVIAKVSSPKREELNRAKGSKLDDVKAYKKKLRVNNEVGTGEYYSITVLQYYSITGEYYSSLCAK